MLFFTFTLILQYKRTEINEIKPKKLIFYTHEQLPSTYKIIKITKLSSFFIFTGNKTNQTKKVKIKKTHFYYIKKNHKRNQKKSKQIPLIKID